MRRSPGLDPPCVSVAHVRSAYAAPQPSLPLHVGSEKSPWCVVNWLLILYRARFEESARARARARARATGRARGCVRAASRVNRPN